MRFNVCEDRCLQPVLLMADTMLMASPVTTHTRFKVPAVSNEMDCHTTIRLCLLRKRMLIHLIV